MIWLWLICFSCAAPLVAAVVTGRVELRDSRARSADGVILWLQPAAPGASGKPHRAVMVQKGKKFIPHILAVQKGAAVDFPNYDPIFHNAFSNYSGQVFDVGLYKPGSTRTVQFSRPGVVRIFCNIHANMSAVVVVVDTPYYATTEKDGSFRIEGVPPGEYKLEAFHERATPEELSKLARMVLVDKSDHGLGTVVISESGYLPAPHLNKFSKPYSAQSESYKVMK